MGNNEVRGVQHSSEQYSHLPEQGGRRGLVEVKEKVMWGSGSSVFILNKSGRWRKVSNVKYEWSSLSALNNMPVAVGGVTDYGYSTEVVVWNGKQWSSLTHMLVGCYGSCVVRDGIGGLLVIGGDGDSGLLDVVQWFDVETKTWFYGPSLPKPCETMSAVVHDGVVYLMGGLDMDRCVWLSNISQLKTKRVRPHTGGSVWRKLPDVPCERSSVCVVDGILLSIGGRDLQSKITSTIYAFHVTENKWQLIGNLPFECWYTDSLLLSTGELLVVDGIGQRALRLNVKGLSDFIHQTNYVIQENIDAHPSGENPHSDGGGDNTKTPDFTLSKEKTSNSSDDSSLLEVKTSGSQFSGPVMPKTNETDKCTSDLKKKLAIAKERATVAEQRAIASEGSIAAAEQATSSERIRANQNEQRAIAAEHKTTAAEERATIAEQNVTTLQQELRTSDEIIARLKMRCLELQHLQLQPSRPHWVVDAEEIALTNEELGRGGWGVVKVAMFRGVKVAAKCLHTDIISKYNEGVFTREMNMASRIRHPNLVQFIGATIRGQPTILTELMSTSVRAVLVTRPLSQSEILSIGTDVALALNYLHLTKPHPIIHRDVSSANVLLEPTGACSWKAKVSDFGSANYVLYSNTVGAGNPMYCAPENKYPEKHSPKLDVYSYGVLLLEMCTQTLPDDISSLLLEVKQSSILPLLTDCLKEDPNLRLSMEDVLSRLTILKV